jgi:hypothetical protein
MQEGVHCDSSFVFSPLKCNKQEQMELELDLPHKARQRTGRERENAPSGAGRGRWAEAPEQGGKAALPQALPPGFPHIKTPPDHFDEVKGIRRSAPDPGNLTGSRSCSSEVIGHFSAASAKASSIQQSNGKMAREITVKDKEV